MSEDGVEKKVYEVVLNDKQIRVMDYIERGISLFVTGPAGTGKSFLIKHIAKTVKKAVTVTAMTGAAGFIIGGRTIHSWGGIGLGDKSVTELISNVRRNRTIRDRWLKTDILIIDEISMMTIDLFEKLEEIARVVRRSPLPFGGIKIVLFGDFCQLPPIVKDSKDDEKPFVFKSRKWNSAIQCTVTLDEIIRQTDPKFQYCLNQIRMGECDVKTKRRLMRRIVDPSIPIEGDIMPTRLYTTRRDVSDLNSIELSKLKSDQYHTHSATTEICAIDPSKPLERKPEKRLVDKIVTTMDRDCPYDAELKLCIGAQVMLITNMDASIGLTNGSRGVIRSYNGKGFPIVEFSNGIKEVILCHDWEFIDHEHGFVVLRKQIPLILAWAITIHKSQGATLDHVEIDIGESIFEYGQTYVALSRVKTLKGLRILSFSKSKIKTHKDVIDFYKRIEEENVESCSSSDETEVEPSDKYSIV